MPSATLVVACAGLVGMTSVAIPANGFSPLFNGKDLAGWKLRKGSTPLEGKTEAAGGRFRVREGALVIDPKIRGDVILETVQTFAGDTTIRFEFKPGPKCNNDLFFRGIKFDIKPKDVPSLKEGEWNTFEIAVSGRTATFRCNDQVLATKPAQAEASPLGIRAEFGAMEFRNIRAVVGK